MRDFFTASPPHLYTSRFLQASTRHPAFHSGGGGRKSPIRDACGASNALSCSRSARLHSAVIAPGVQRRESYRPSTRRRTQHPRHHHRTSRSSHSRNEPHSEVVTRERNGGGGGACDAIPEAPCSGSRRRDTQETPPGMSWCVCSDSTSIGPPHVHRQAVWSSPSGWPGYNLHYKLPEDQRHLSIIKAAPSPSLHSTHSLTSLLSYFVVRCAFVIFSCLVVQCFSSLVHLKIQRFLQFNLWKWKSEWRHHWTSQYHHFTSSFFFNFQYCEFTPQSCCTRLFGHHYIKRHFLLAFSSGFRHPSKRLSNNSTIKSKIWTIMTICLQRWLSLFLNYNNSY